MLERGTRTKPTDQKFIVSVGLIAAVLIIIAALLWTPFDRQSAPNDPWVGSTAETSQKNPGQPTGPLTKDGG